MKLFFLFLIISFLFSGCSNRGREAGASSVTGPSILVFIPGVVAGSATYEMLEEGVRRAVDDYSAANPAANPAPTITVIEGGFNQAAWEGQIMTLAASGNYDLIASSNPSLPEIVSVVSRSFPEQKFLLLDAEMAGNPNVYSFRFNQREKTFMSGYLAALVSLEERPDSRRIGFVAAQEYPVLNDILLPGFIEGAQAVDPGFTVDFRVVGNWFDAARAAELAAGMIRDGVTAILPIAGGASHGVVQAASEAGAKVVWIDTNGYGIRPGTVIGSVILRQDRAAYETTLAFLHGTLPFGTAELKGTADGFVDFIDDDPDYIAHVSQTVRDRQAELVNRLRTGVLLIDELGR
ncbi:MAG: BMP family ABC transporter substrate-binding protein [Treponema sp.]|nr:BMP family ABC transporter substrate-binding protein [Treponema sp.]